MCFRFTALDLNLCHRGTQEEEGSVRFGITPEVSHPAGQTWVEEQFVVVQVLRASPPPSGFPGEAPKAGPTHLNP